MAREAIAGVPPGVSVRRPANGIGRHDLSRMCYATHLNYSSPQSMKILVTFSTRPGPRKDPEPSQLRVDASSRHQSAHPVRSRACKDRDHRTRARSSTGRQEGHASPTWANRSRVKVKALDGGAWTLVLKGRVFGDVTLLSGAETGQVELGQSLAADQTHSKDVYLLAERSGLDLTLEKADIFPSYLQESKLEARPADKDGRKSWVLHVILPKNSLFGHLPESSSIVVKTTGPNPRRFRIPVRGSTFQSSGPRL